MSDSDMAGAVQAAIVARALEDCGMIALRGDFETEDVADSVSNWTGSELPASGRCISSASALVAWMAPDELLLFVPFQELEQLLGSIRNLGQTAQLSAADVSDMRIVFEVSGPGFRDVVAKGTPLDLSSEAFGPGTFRRTRLGQVAVLVWMEEGPSIRIACRRSEADYVDEFLRVGASAGVPGFYGSV